MHTKLSCVRAPFAAMDAFAQVDRFSAAVSANDVGT
eukprot:SAG11_NODE_1293_length_5284_cov_2.541562_8_plen_35_part_01